MLWQVEGVVRLILRDGIGFRSLIRLRILFGLIVYIAI